MVSCLSSYKELCEFFMILLLMCFCHERETKNTAADFWKLHSRLLLIVLWIAGNGEPDQ